MIKRILSVLEGVTMTAVGGVLLLVSLLLSVFKLEIPLYLEPSILTVLISGLPILFSAVRKLIYNKGIKRISSALLITVAMCASVIIGDLFAAGEIAFIMALGEILEHRARERAKKGIQKLLSLVPQTAQRVTDKKEETVPVGEIVTGDIVRIRPGESVSCDGVIISGSTCVDESAITGESLPCDKKEGDSVYCGTLNCFGSADIRVTEAGEGTTLQRLIKALREAENKKAPMQRTADKWASILVPVALLLAVVSGVLMHDAVVAVTVLVVFCPCALVLATPTAIMAATGNASRNGIIIKSGEALERLSTVNTVAFDKTGTLTSASLEVTDVVSFDGNISSDEILSLTASAESYSEHPLAKALVKSARDRGLTVKQSKDFRMSAGKGVYCVVSEKEMLCGNEKLMTENGISIPHTVNQTAREIQNDGKAVVFVSAQKRVVGIIALSDTLRGNVYELTRSLRKEGVESVLLTGDNIRSASYFASLAGIDKVYAGLLPNEKAETVEKLVSDGKTVCMVGDGVNDALSLKTADVGIAMAKTGSDIAVDSADIALMSDDISKLLYLKRLSETTVRTIKWGIALSLIINFVAIILSFFSILTPTTGALVHNLGSLFVIFMASLLYERRL